MRYRTVNLAPDTYERLKTYKVAGRSFDEVVNDLMDAMPLERVSARLLREHKRRLARMRKGDYVTLDQMKRFIRS